MTKFEEWYESTGVDLCGTLQELSQIEIGLVHAWNAALEAAARSFSDVRKGLDNGMEDVHPRRASDIAVEQCIYAARFLKEPE